MMAYYKYNVSITHIFIKGIWHIIVSGHNRCKMAHWKSNNMTINTRKVNKYGIVHELNIWHKTW